MVVKKWGVARVYICVMCEERERELFREDLILIVGMKKM